jgi:hypothetical protein
MDRIKKLEKEIKNLEEKLSKSHFSGLVDRAARARDEKKLRKLQKELEDLKKKKK